jgi:starvation-inducible DNA-binding protein
MNSIALGENMAIDIGISEEDRKSIVEGLSRLLSDTYVLYLKTHNFHWNVTGPMFRTLHLMFEEQYNELALAVDLIAERIRALGFRRRVPIQSMRACLPSRRKKVCQRRGHDQAIGRRPGGSDTHGSRHLPLLDKVSDEPTADLLTQRMQVHEKTAWMLRSLLAE